jgi:predicted transcriptional regulator
VTAQRDRIRRYVATHPGVHFNELTRQLDLATGQVQYHLRKLRGAGDVVAEPLYGRTHYYPPEYEEWERGAIAVLHRETARDVLCYLIDEGPSAPDRVAADLDIARSTLEWHLDHLTERGLVEKRRDDRHRVTLTLARPDETARMLREIEPSLPERLVDRFDRLLDNLVADE